MRVKATDNGRKAVHLFIGELLGHKGGTPAEKAEFGKQSHLNRNFLNLDLDTEKGREKLHVNIWLERLYDELDQYAVSQGEPFYWSVPIELDYSASMLGILGLLLGDKRLLEMTNMSFTGVLNDPWKFPGIPRDQFKKAATPMLYGSSKSCTDLWKKHKMEYMLEQVKAYNEELANGALGVANDVKDFLIRNAKPAESMEIRLYEDTFQIQCNRHRNVGEYVVSYDIYDTGTKSIKRIKHVHTKRVADLEAFRTYFPTLMVHGIDSQIMNHTVDKVMNKYEWCIDIHDALIVSPEAADDVRKWSAEKLQHIYNNRQIILDNFFNSIGITAASLPEWRKILAKVVPVENFVASGYALK